MQIYISPKQIGRKSIIIQDYEKSLSYAVLRDDFARVAQNKTTKGASAVRKAMEVA